MIKTADSPKDSAMTGTMLACILTIAVGCYMFLYLAGKQNEIEEKDREIRGWTERHEAQREVQGTQATPTVTLTGVQAGQETPPLAPAAVGESEAPT